MTAKDEDEVHKNIARFIQDYASHVDDGLAFESIAFAPGAVIAIEIVDVRQESTEQ